MNRPALPRPSGRRAWGLALAGALAAGTLTALPAATATASTARTTPAVATSATEAVDDATFTWGLNGYAQRGIFGPWRILDLTGDASLLQGEVSGGTQDEYVVGAVPETSMPPAVGGGEALTPNAVRLAGGEGEVDPATGEADLAWDGSYTVNAYPAVYGAPDEIYADPELSVAADGSGELSMDVTIGAGQDMGGEPTEAQPLGRQVVATFSPGSVGDLDATGFRLTPDYQGVENGIENQAKTCTATGGATGWWGSWPAAFVAAMPDFVNPHFYSTGCGGMQDYKPALPVDVGLTPAEPTVTVSDTSLDADTTTEVTVTGTGFRPELATATRPPLAGRPAGAYVVLGRFAETWRPSEGATSAARRGAATRWAVTAQDVATIGGPGAGAIELSPDGDFTATFAVDKAALDAASPTGVYGIYTYTGGGAVFAPYETATPITFSSTPTLAVDGPEQVTVGETLDLGVDVTGSATTTATATGAVTVSAGGETLASADLVDGRADLVVEGLRAGTHQLVVSYAGDATYAPGTTSYDVTVVKQKALLKVGTASSTYGEVAELAVSAAPGTATVVARQGGRELARTRLVDGTGTLALPATLTAGRHELVVRLLATPQVATATRSRVVAVAKAPTTTTVRVAPRPAPAGTRPTAVARVASGTGTTVGGQVQVSLDGTRVRTAPLSDGVVRVALPARDRGRHTVLVVYPGATNHARSRDTAIYRARG